jgi:hypothetical protein
MKLPSWEMQGLYNAFVSGTELEWSEYISDLKECYNCNNDDIAEALVSLGLLKSIPEQHRFHLD